MTATAGPRPDGRALPASVFLQRLPAPLAAWLEAVEPDPGPSSCRVLRLFRDRGAGVISTAQPHAARAALVAGALGAACEVRGAAGPAFVLVGACDDAAASLRSLAQGASVALGDPAVAPPRVVAAADLATFDVTGAVLGVENLRAVRDALGAEVVVDRLRRARAVIATTGPLPDLELWTAAICPPGAVFADDVAWARIRTRAWAPGRGDPWPPAATARAGIVRELLRIAVSDGPLRAVGVRERALIAAAEAALLVGMDPPPDVSGVACREARVVRAALGDALEGSGEIVVLGDVLPLDALAAMVLPTGDGDGAGVRLTWMAQSAWDLAAAAVARVRLARGELSAGGDRRPAQGAWLDVATARGFARLCESLAAELASRGAGFAAAAMVTEYGVNRGNAAAFVELLRQQAAVSGVPTPTSAVLESWNDAEGTRAALLAGLGAGGGWELASAVAHAGGPAASVIDDRGVVFAGGLDGAGAKAARRWLGDARTLDLSERRLDTASPFADALLRSLTGRDGIA